MSQFGYLKECSVSDESRATFQLIHVRGRPILELAPMTAENRPFLAEALRKPVRPAARTATGAEWEAARKSTRIADAEVMAKHVLRGWRGVYDMAGIEVAFSAEAARDFLLSLAEHAGWIFDEIVAFATNPANFTRGLLEVEEAAKNSVGGSPGK